MSAATLPSTGAGGGGRGCVSNRVFSAIILWKPIPTPSMTANKIAHPIAPFRTAFGPPRTASAPPVKKPAMIAFHGSSFLLLYASVSCPFSRSSYGCDVPDTLDSAVESREHATPDTKITSKNRCSRLDRSESCRPVSGRSCVYKQLGVYLLSFARHTDCF